MTDRTSLTEIVRSLSKDTAVTVTTADGSAYEMRVYSARTKRGGDYVQVTLWNDEYDMGSLKLHTNDSVSVTFNPPERHVTEEGDTVVDIETHGIVVDQNEPVKHEGYPSKVAECPECEGGLMTLVWGGVGRSTADFRCQDCGAEDQFHTYDEGVRNPTRREWVEINIEKDQNPYTNIPDRYLLEDESPIGFYYKEECPRGHYKRCEVSKTGDPRSEGAKERDIQMCPDCGNETDTLARTCKGGLEKWGEPENYGGDIPEELTEAIEAVKTGEFALRVSIPEDKIGRRYFKAYLVQTDDGVQIDIVNGGTPLLESDAGGIGRVAYWYNQSENPKLVPIMEYEQADDTAAA